MTAADFTLQDEGTIVVLHPQNDAARGWIDENLYSAQPEDRPQWWGGGIVVEHRYVRDIVAGIRADGLEVS